MKILVELTDKSSINSLLTMLDYCSDNGINADITFVCIMMPGIGATSLIMNTAEILSDYIDDHYVGAHTISGFYNFDDTEGFWSPAIGNMKENLEKYGFCSPGIYNVFLRHTIAEYIGSKMDVDKIVVGYDMNLSCLLSEDNVKDMHQYIADNFGISIISAESDDESKYDEFMSSANIICNDINPIDLIGDGGWTKDDVTDDQVSAYINDVVKPTIDTVWSDMNIIGFEYT